MSACEQQQPHKFRTAHMLARWNLPVISFILNLVSSPLYDSVSFSFLKQHLLHQSRAFHLVSHGHRSAGSTPQPNRSAAALSSCWDAYPPSLSNQSARNLWIPAPPEAVSVPGVAHLSQRRFAYPVPGARGRSWPRAPHQFPGAGFRRCRRWCCCC